MLILSHAHGACPTPEGEIRRGQKVINEMITCLYNPNGDHTSGFFTAVPELSS